MTEHYQIADEKIKELEKRLEALELQSYYNTINAAMLKNKIKDLSEKLENVEKRIKIISIDMSLLAYLTEM